MNYEDALKAWGATRIRGQYPKVDFDPSSVTVEMDFDEGYACCGGSIEGCYCSFAESPSANVVISAKTALKKNRKTVYETISVKISHYEFDFSQILSEIVEAADGTVTDVIH